MSIRFAAIGFSHNHIYNQVNALLNAGATLVSFYSDDPERNAEFSARYPFANATNSIQEILDDSTIHLVVSAVIPSERPSLGIRVMEHGKDYSCAKPGFTTLGQLAEVRHVQRETQRIFAVHFGERIDSPSTVKAGELVHSGAIGQVIQMTGFGPHRFLGHGHRPDWAHDKQFYGGILNDLASHQVEQFLFFTGSTRTEVVFSQTGNINHKQFPHFEDYGDILLKSECATAYIRVDWMTPKGLDTWGDGRLFLIGTQGQIEIRKNCDLAGRPGSNHLFLIDGQSTRYIDCSNMQLPYAGQLIEDILNRTQTAASQERTFLASELTLIAKQQALPFTV